MTAPRKEKTKKTFVARTMDVPDDMPVPKIIRSRDLNKVYHVDQYLHKILNKLEDYRVAQKKKIEEKSVDILKDLQVIAARRFLTKLETFQEHQDQYFEQIESHCAAIVKQAIHTLVASVDCDEKIISSVKQASVAIKDQTQVTLHVHPDDKALVEAIAEQRQWSIKTNPELRPGQCRFHVPFGTYTSDFKTNVQVLEAIFDA